MDIHLAQILVTLLLIIALLLLLLLLLMGYLLWLQYQDLANSHPRRAGQRKM
jgi:uncharacterized iron-regulated membrane protein